MRKDRYYKNAGGCGPDYSCLTVSKLDRITYADPTILELKIYNEKRELHDIILNLEQVRDLRDQLSKVLRHLPNPKPKVTMIDGDELS